MLLASVYRNKIEVKKAGPHIVMLPPILAGAIAVVASSVQLANASPSDNIATPDKAEILVAPLWRFLAGAVVISALVRAVSKGLYL